MLNAVDRVFALLLLLGATGHTLGSFEAFGHQPSVLIWALCGSLLAVLLGALNLLRSWRPGDRALAWITVVGMVGWMAVSIAFGQVIQNPFDPRPVIFEIISAGLIVFGLRTALIPAMAAAPQR